MEKKIKTKSRFVALHVKIPHMPTQKLFPGKKNHQNPEHSTVFRNTLANISKINLVTRFYVKITGQSILYTSLTPFHTAQKAADHAQLPVSPTISQQCYELQSSCKCPLSHHWWQHCSSYAFSNILKPPSRWRWYCRCAINRLSHAFPSTQNTFSNGALISKMYSSCSFMDAMLS